MIGSRQSKRSSTTWDCLASCTSDFVRSYGGIVSLADRRFDLACCACPVERVLRRCLQHTSSFATMKTMATCKTRAIRAIRGMSSNISHSGMEEIAICRSVARSVKGMSIFAIRSGDRRSKTATGTGYSATWCIPTCTWETEFRFFGQIKSGVELGRAGGPRGADEDKLDLHQAFVDIRAWTHGKDGLTLRIGRQELSLGSSRLVSFREGPNVRQSFDGLRLGWHRGDWQIDGLATKPVRDKARIL